MFSTSHLPPSLSESLFLSLSLSHTYTLSLSVMLFVILSFFLLSVFTQKFPFFSCFSLFALFLFGYFLCSLACAHSCIRTRMDTDTRRQTCVVESERVSVLFSGQSGLIFSTFCFHTLTDSPQAETERERETHREEAEQRKQRHHSLNVTFRHFIMMTGMYTHSHAHTGLGRHTS